MEMVLEHINKPDIIAVLENEGIEIKRRGNRYWGLCFAHSENRPSFMVDPIKQTGHAFCCGWHGDVIKFIQDYKNLSFADALRYLGISTGNYSPEAVQKIKREQTKKALVKEYRQWLDNYTNFLCNVLRRLDRAKMKAKTMAEVEKMAYHYHHEQIWEYHFKIMLAIDEKAKFELYRELKYDRG